MNRSIRTGRSRNLSTIPTTGLRQAAALWRGGESRRPIRSRLCLPWTPAGVWHFYDGRAEMEPRIRELREDYALRKIPTRAFAANALYLEVVRLAYNLVTAFQRTCLPGEWQSLTLSRLRSR